VNRGAFLGAGGAFALLPHLARASSYEHIEQIAHEVPGVVGVYCRTLAVGAPVLTFNDDTVFPTASTIKTLIMTTAYVEEERNPGTLAHRITTHRSDLIGGSEFMETQPEGARLSVYELIVPMITLSDNTASNYLISYFGMAKINAVGASIGMTQTHLERHFLDFGAIVHHNDNTTTPADMSKLLFAIASGAREGTATVCSTEHCRAMIKVMLGQTDRDKIPAGLPAGVPVAHKTGELDGSRSDIAIVEPFGDSPYILVLYSKWLTEYPPVYDAFRRIARLSYQMVNKTDQ
jgi:beta-lactamase class A